MSETREDRLHVAAWKLAASKDALEALLKGLPVPRDQLRPEALGILQQPTEGPDYLLSDDDALRLVLWTRNGAKEEKPAGRAHSWMPVNLADAALEPPEPPTIGGLVYPGRRHVFSGEPESLKTWAALALCVECLRDDRYVVYVDMENGQRAIHERLRALGLVDEEIGRFLYVNPDEPMTDPAVMGDVQGMLNFARPALFVADSFTGALALHGCDPNSSVEVEAFYRTVVDPIQTSGAAFLALDHLTKDKEKRGKFSIGSERKIGGADVHLGFEVVTPFGRGKNGLAKVTAHKDRPGYLARPKAAELFMESMEGSGAVTWQIRPGEDSQSDEFRPTHLMQKVWNYVNSRASSNPSKHQIEEAVRGKRDYVRVAVEALVADGYLECREEAGAHLYSVVKVYEEAA